MRICQIVCSPENIQDHLQSCFYVFASTHFLRTTKEINLACTVASVAFCFKFLVFISQEMRVNQTLSLSLPLVYSRLKRRLTLWNPSGCCLAVYGHRDRTPAPRPAFVYRRTHIYIIWAILSFCGRPFDRWSDRGGSRTS